MSKVSINDAFFSQCCLCGNDHQLFKLQKPIYTIKLSSVCVSVSAFVGFNFYETPGHVNMKLGTIYHCFGVTAIRRFCNIMMIS